MTRAIDSSTLAAIEGGNATPIYFVQLLWDSNPDRLHTGLGTINWNSHNWTGVGDFGFVDSVREGNTISPEVIRLGLSGLSSDMTDLVFSTNYYRRPCSLYLGALSDGSLVADPSLIFSGFVESIDMVLGDDGGDIVTLTAESELILFKRSRNVRYTNTQLQEEYSGDLGMEYKEAVATQSIVWRGKNNGLGGGSSRGWQPGDGSFDGSQYDR